MKLAAALTCLAFFPFTVVSQESCETLGITNEDQCDEKCGNEDDSNFILNLVDVEGDSTEISKVYNGFTCKCNNVDCVYSYDFPTCQSVGVENCNRPKVTCDSYCASLGFADSLCSRYEVETKWTACSCEVDLMSDDMEPIEGFFVCGDEGFDQEPESGADHSRRIMDVVLYGLMAVSALSLIG